MSRSFAPSLNSKEEPELKANVNNFLSNSLIKHFGTLRDPRIERSKDHLLVDIIAIAILAVISGAEGWVGIETYGKAKYEWLKANQRSLYGEVKAWFNLAKKEGILETKASHYQEVSSGHNRIEKREVWAVNASELPSLQNQSLWTKLSTIVMVVSERRLWNKTTKEVRFYISSLDNNAEKIAKAIRSHWGIENSLHWTLDVTFSEDSSRIRKDNSPENFALLRRLALNLLKQEKTDKGSLKMKRYRASMDNNYLMKILALVRNEVAI